MKRKITGFMIWNFDHLELIEAIYNDKKLEEIFEKSKKTVQNTIKWYHMKWNEIKMKVIVRLM